MKAERPPILQAGVIPFRPGSRRDLEVLLVRRTAKKKWGIPKGTVKPGHTPLETAQREAFEEAGAAGQISEQPLGVYRHKKRGRPHLVQVFLLYVFQTLRSYPERKERVRRWLSVERAVEVVARDEVAELIGSLPQLIRRGPHGRIAFIPQSHRLR